MTENTMAKVKYYGTLMATLFVLALSTDHISQALLIVEKSGIDSEMSSTWFAGVGLQVFEVLTAVGVADLLMRRKRSNVVLVLLIFLLMFFFMINLGGNILYAFSNMTDVAGKELVFNDIKQLDTLQIIWVLWASVPIPLMGLAGVTVQAIFRKEIKPEAKPVGVVKKSENENQTLVNSEPIASEYEKTKTIYSKK